MFDPGAAPAAASPPAAALLLRHVMAAMPDLQRQSRTQPDLFPDENIEALRRIGVLQAPLPRALGGLGLGSEPLAADDCALMLAAIGESGLALGRVFEAHVNAIRLLVRLGDCALRERLARRLREGALFALWVTDGASPPPLRGAWDGGILRLAGGKAVCSAAGHATDAVVTADLGDAQPRLLWVGLRAGERVAQAAIGLTGMRASATGAVDFTGMDLSADAAFGAPGAYLREPDFSTGAWRGSAVAWGGLRALIACVRQQLRARGRAGDPHQQARFGTLMIAGETARHFVRAASRHGEDADADPAQAIAYVNLARIAVERACLDGIELAQRALGLQAFVLDNPVAQICQDLAVYLRQPAPDEVLANAACHGLARPGFP